MLLDDKMRSELLARYEGIYPLTGSGPKKWHQQVAEELDDHFDLKQNMVTPMQVKGWTTRGGNGGYGEVEEDISATFD